MNGSGHRRGVKRHSLAATILAAWIATGALAPAALAAGRPVSGAPPVTDIAADPGTGLGEPEVHVDPRDPRDVVIGENNTGVSVSRDGGLSFSHVALSNPGDNALAVQPDGTFVYTALDGQVHVSGDGGRTWHTVGNWVGAVAAQTDLASPVPGGTVAVRQVGCSAPEPAGPVTDGPSPDGPGPQLIGCDRPWLAADAQTGELYASFTDHDDAPGGSLSIPWELSDLACRGTVLVNPVFECGRQYVAHSTNGGRTWSSFAPMDTAAYPAAGTGGFSGGPVAAHGVLATAYAATGRGCQYCVVFETSRDAGRSWQQHLTPASIVPAGLSSFENQLSDDATLLFQPYVTADPSRRGRYAVMVPSPDQSKLLVYVTADSGRTWQGPASLSSPSAHTLYLPWLAYGPTGALGAMWKCGYADGTFAAYAAVSPAGGTSFAPPVRLSSASSPGPAFQTAGDDASGVTLDARSLFAVWGDRRGGSLGIHFARYDFAKDPAVRTR